jgi:hypothetical protein
MSNQAERFSKDRVDCPRCSGHRRIEMRVTTTAVLPCECPSCHGEGKVGRGKARRIVREMANEVKHADG